MKKYKILIILLMTNIVLTFAGEKKIDEKSSSFPELFGKPFLSQILHTDFSETPQSGLTKKLTKSPGKGFLFSLAIPGLGEIYSKSKLKGYIFLGVETVAWLSFIIHKNKGKDWREQYINYAENNWDRQRWSEWWNSLPLTDQERFPRYELPDQKNDDYYEMIGKYEKFNAGWMDSHWVPGSFKNEVSEASLFYMDLRKNYNSEYKLASTSTAVIFANHILSSLDAVWCVKQFNKNFKATSKLNYVFINDQPVVLAGVSVDW